MRFSDHADRTFWVEALAEEIEKPLITVGAGSLPRNPTKLREHLVNILDLALRWDAIVLVDDVDALIEDKDSVDVSIDCVRSGKYPLS